MVIDRIPFVYRSRQEHNFLDRDFRRATPEPASMATCSRSVLRMLSTVISCAERWSIMGRYEVDNTYRSIIGGVRYHSLNYNNYSPAYLCTCTNLAPRVWNPYWHIKARVREFKLTAQRRVWWRQPSTYAHEVWNRVEEARIATDEALSAHPLETHHVTLCWK